jgi:hypothetical protein
MRIAVVDPASSVLPYAFQLIKGLAQRGDALSFYGSTTRYNGELIDAMRALPGVRVVAHAISRSVAPRLLGLLAYAALLLRLLFASRRFDLINLQFPVLWAVEWFVFGVLLRRKFVFTVHNAVPHGFEGLQHPFTRRLADRAQRLIFVSTATRDDFFARYGERYRTKSVVLPHGLVPLSPEMGETPYRPAPMPRRLVFWSNVKPYKGVELFAALAVHPAVRQRGLSLAVYGAWATELAPLKQELKALGVTVVDRFLNTAELAQLLQEDALFVLPYQNASQSGALYTLLNHGRLFICTDVGDLGSFMRRAGLQSLLLRSRRPEAVLACLDHLAAHPHEVAVALRQAQGELRWGALLSAVPQAYAPLPG